MNSVTFCGGESTGSIGKRDLNLARYQRSSELVPEQDAKIYTDKGAKKYTLPTFNGGESTGSVGKKDSLNSYLRTNSDGDVLVVEASKNDKLSFCGGESTGSVGKRSTYSGFYEKDSTMDSDNDNVIFRGDNTKKSSSVLLKILGGLAVTGAVIGGLAYAHKKDAFAKVGEGKFKETAQNVSEHCYNWCQSLKKQAVNTYDKIKSFFGKK